MTFDRSLISRYHRADKGVIAAKNLPGNPAVPVLSRPDRGVARQFHSTQPALRTLAAATGLRPSPVPSVLGGLAAATGLGPGPASQPPRPHAVAMHANRLGQPVFMAPTYVNPEAPKGGQLTQGVLGAFDSLNPFIVKGLPAANIRGYVIESLLARGYDEPFTLYGTAREKVVTDERRSFVTFTINGRRAFPTGARSRPRTWCSFNLLRDHGRPLFGIYYNKVAKVEARNERTVHFDLTGAMIANCR